MSVKYGLLAALLVLLPNVVHADQVRVTSYDVDDNGGTVRLMSDATLGEPWMRIDNRMLRIWFPHVVQVARFDHEREASEPIHSLSLRPGAADTAVLRVELGPSRPLTKDDVEIVRNGREATITLHVVSPTRVAARENAAPPVPARAAQPAHVEPQAVPVAAVAPQPKAAEPVAVPQPTAAAATPLGAAQPSTPAAPAAEAKDEDANPLGTLTDQAGKNNNPMLWLGLATILLGGVYGTLQIFNKRKPKIASSIEVLGTRRLGVRQELVIVRALGADHLLLCTGGRAERVASTPTLTDIPLEAPALPDPDPKAAPSQAGGIGLISRLSSQHRLRKLLDSVDNDVPDHDEEQERDSRFGTELYSASQRQRSNGPVQSLPAPMLRQSDAVAGITRLRQRKSS